MVEVDEDNYKLHWLDYGEPELAGKDWSIRMKEFSDDLRQVGFDATASFKFKRVSHINLNFDAL